MLSSKPKTAEANFRSAFERLKAGASQVLPSGSPVSQNNVAKEAGCDPSALRKSRFPGLVDEIQTFIASCGNARPPSERQRLLRARQVSRSKSEAIIDLKIQRDTAASLLVEANVRIGILTRKVRDMEARLEDLQSQSSILPMPPTPPRTTPRAMDIRGKK